MQVTLKFILCSSYDFDDKGKHMQGFSCRCYDAKANKIVKVKTDKDLPYVFGDDVTVDVVPNGNYLNYEIH